MTRASRFRLVIAAAALVLAIGPSTRAGDAPAPTEEDRAWERALQAAAEKRGEARTLLEECVAKYPKAESVPQALQYLSWIYVATTTARDRQLALECAKRVQAEFPRSNQAHDPHWIEQMAGIHFSSLANRLPGPRSAEHPVPPLLVKRAEVVPPPEPKGPGPHYFEFRTIGRSSFVFYRVPAEALQRLLDAEPIPEEPGSYDHDDDALVARVPRESWVKVAERALEPGESSLSIKLPLGLYVIVEKVEGLFKESVLRVRDLGIVVKSLGGRALVFAADASTGAPREGVDLNLRLKDRTLAGKTGKDGLAWFDAPSNGFLTAREGEEMHTCELTGTPLPKEQLVYITTDRPIYRPGHTVCWKAILRQREAGKLALGKREKVKVEVRDPESRVLASSEPEWDALGTITGSFKLGDEPPLGDYSIAVRVENSRTHAYLRWDTDDPNVKVNPWKKTFKVAAYRKPEFRVGVEIAGSGSGKVRATVRAEYYFGGPVADATVEWTASRRWEIAARRWPKPPFEDPRAWLYERPKPARDDDSRYDSADIANGSGKTGPDGTLQVEFDPKDASLDESFTLTASVTDLSRLTVTGMGVVPVCEASLRVDAGATRMFYAMGETVHALARVTAPDGKPLRGRAVDFAVFGANDAPRATDDGPREVEYVSFATGSVTTDERGLAVFDAKAIQGGRVRIRARARDDMGRIAEARSDLWIAGEEAALRAPTEEERKNAWPEVEALSVLPDRLVHETGETMRLMIRSIKRPLTALLTVEGETIHEARLVTLERACQILEVPVTASFSPVVHVRLHAPGADEGVGAAYEVYVAPRGGLVDVSVATDRPSYAPHQKAKVTVTTRSQGKPVAADVELVLVDESVYAIEEDRTKDIRRFFHEVYLDRAFESGLRERWHEVRTFDGGPARYSQRHGFTGGGAGRAMAGAAISFADDKRAAPDPDVAPTDTRHVFPDSLLVAPHVATGADGAAVVEVEMPDSLTTWRLTARAACGADSFGWTAAKAVSRKDLILRLEAPRFYTERDESTVATIVHNDLPDAASVTVKLQVEGAESDAGERKLEVASHAVARVDWKLKATHPGTVKLHAEALSRVESDAVEIEVPVRPHGVERRLFRSGSVGDSWRETVVVPESAAGGSAWLEVVVSSSGMAAVDEALPFLAGYPYG